MSMKIIYELQSQVTILRKKVREYEQFINKIADNYNPKTNGPFTLEELMKIAQNMIANKK